MSKRSQAASERRPPDLSAVSWRDGVHIGGTSIWCDALRARDVCFVSAAHAVPASRHGQLIATEPTLRLLARDNERLRPTAVLSVPYGRPFTLGTLRLELFCSGHAIGSASLAVQLGDRRVVYAGAVNPGGGGLGGVADVRPCDALILSAAYGHPRYSFPPVDTVVADVIGFCREVTGAGGTAVLLCTSAAKGLDIAARLGDHSIDAHRAIHRAARRLAGLAPGLPPLRRFSGKARPGRVLLWLARARPALDSVTLPGGSGLALVSGAALEPETVEAMRVDAGFPWSNQADHRGLLDTIEASGARAVYLTHRFAAELTLLLEKRGLAARPLAPPKQMALF